MNILLVEDNEGDIELTELAFRRRKLSSTLAVAHNGVEAVDYLSCRGAFTEAVRPDLVLLDLNMPRMGGREFLEIVKQDEKFRSIPVIVFTSSSAPKDIAECYERHANCYILKPFDPEEFMDIAKKVEDFWGRLAHLPGEREHRISDAHIPPQLKAGA
ncbi:MAG: response regulator [Alphaproteobacteria bacterium]|nr:response regulator [Alphaproteobacteria bacterium]